MKLFKKNENKKTTKLPMTGKVKKSFRYYCMAVMAMTFVLGTSVTAFAANDPIQVVNNLSDFIFGLVRAVGMIMLGFGIVQIGLILSILVDTFSSRISLTMPPSPKPHNTACVLS